MTDFLVRLLQKGAPGSVAIRPRLASRFEVGVATSPVPPNALETVVDEEMRSPVDGIGRLRVVEDEFPALERRGATSRPRSPGEPLEPHRERSGVASARGPRASRADVEASAVPVGREPDTGRRARRGTDVPPPTSSTPDSRRSRRATRGDDGSEAETTARELDRSRTRRRARSVVPDAGVADDAADRVSLAAAARPRDGERPMTRTADRGGMASALEVGISSRAAARHTAESTPTDRVAAATVASEPTLRPAAVDRGIAPSVDAVRTPPQARVLSAEAADPGPTVHVTIGRIEVRAEPNVRPIRRARTKGPQLSLEEYLRRRSEAGR